MILNTPSNPNATIVPPSQGLGNPLSRRKPADNPKYELRPNGERASQAIFSLYVVGGVLAALVVSLCAQLYFLPEFKREVFDNLPLFRTIESIHAKLSATLLLACLLSGIFFIRWFRRAYFNLHQLPVRTKYRESWALWSWVVPFANLVYPVRIMLELHAKSDHLLRGHPLAKGVLGKTENVRLWWGLWMVYGVLSGLGDRFATQAYDLNTLQSSYQLQAAISAFGILAAYLAVLVVREYAAIGHALRMVFRSEEDEIIDSFGPAKH